MTATHTINMGFDPRTNTYREDKPLLTDEQKTCLITMPGNLIMGGLWTWGALACFAMPGVGWTLLGGALLFFAILNGIGLLAGVIGFTAGFFG